MRKDLFANAYRGFVLRVHDLEMTQCHWPVDGRAHCDAATQRSATRGHQGRTTAVCQGWAGPRRRQASRQAAEAHGARCCSSAPCEAAARLRVGRSPGPGPGPGSARLWGSRGPPPPNCPWAFRMLPGKRTAPLVRGPLTEKAHGVPAQSSWAAGRPECREPLMDARPAAGTWEGTRSRLVRKLLSRARAAAQKRDEAEVPGPAPST